MIVATLSTGASEAWLATHGSSLDDGVMMFWLFFFVALLCVSLTFGSIAHALMVRVNWRGMQYYLACAILVGAAVAATSLDRILHAAFHMTPWTTGLRLGIIAFGAGVGALTAAIFWLIRRPDRDAPNPDRAAS